MSTRPAPEEVDELFRRYAQTRRRSDRNTLAEAHMGFANHVANRYRNRVIAEEDLRQVAFLALVKAVERFDPEAGVAFTSFAGRTIEGEIKRHFRDAAWSVRVPRSTKELHLRVRRTSDELSHELGRSPTVKEVAARLDVSTDQVVEALGASAAFAHSSLDTAANDDSVPPDRSAHMARTDERLESSDDRLVIQELIDRLPSREQEIVRLRFFEELTQSEIAERVGVSQMHVSRLLRRSFDLMRKASELT